MDDIALGFDNCEGKLFSVKLSFTKVVVKDWSTRITSLDRINWD